MAHGPGGRRPARRLEGSRAKLAAGGHRFASSRRVSSFACRVARWGVLALDRFLVRLYKIEPVAEDSLCLLQVSARPTVLSAPVALDQRLRLSPGAKVVEIHFANARVPRITGQGPDLAWARSFEKGLRYSLSLLASSLVRNPRLADFAAIHGVLSFLPAEKIAWRHRLAERFGFVIELRAASGLRWWRSSFWDLLYSRWLTWAYNPEALRRKAWRDAALTDLWMTRETLLSRYGGAALRPRV